MSEATTSRSRASRREELEAYSITGAQAPHSQGVETRMRRYALKMALRLVCIVLALVTDGWIRWTCVGAAMVLPWVAVVLANGSDRAEVRDVSAYTDPAPRPLPSPDLSGDHASTPREDVIEGEFREGPGASPTRGTGGDGPDPRKGRSWT